MWSCADISALVGIRRVWDRGPAWERVGIGRAGGLSGAQGLRGSSFEATEDRVKCVGGGERERNRDLGRSFWRLGRTSDRPRE